MATKKKPSPRKPAVKVAEQQPVDSALEAGGEEVDYNPSADYLPKKDLFRLDEVAAYFDVTEKTVRLWIDHGHLQAEQIVGGVRINRNSILSLRILKNMEMR